MKNILLSDLKNEVVSGIYKIDFPNGKYYIGQSQNIYKRILEHNQRARVPRKGRSNSLCDLAIKKYGQIDNITILAEVDNLEKLDELETYWITYYDATNKEKGYNIVAYGDASHKKGYDNPNACLSKEDLKEVVDLLQNHLEISQKDIAENFGVSKDIISAINCGHRYTNPALVYPLRPSNNKIFSRKDYKDYFSSEEELIACKEAIIYDWELNMEEDIPKKFNVPRNIIKDINYGRKFAEIGKYTYPLRAMNQVRNIHSLTKEDISNILNLLRNTKLSMTEIGKQYDNMDRSSISRINQGKTYIIKGYDYPARKTK